MKSRLLQPFFDRCVVDVAKDLLGQTLVFGLHQGIITETEAYQGPNDPASHAYRGQTPRSSIMFGKPGISYVYMIYGMYFCLNIVAENEGLPGAVLIRGLHILNDHHEPSLRLDGPGKICRFLGISKEHHNLDLTAHPTFYVISSPKKIISYKETPRIGIRVATDKLWRFVMTDY